MAVRTILVLALLATSLAAQTPEQAALAVLQSGAPAADQEAACQQLKRVGTAAAVPALARLLADEHLAQWALDALVTLPAPEAGAALRGALETARGATLAGVIHALGERRDVAARPALAKLLASPDALVATAAARALGRLGGAPVVAALREALGQGQAPREAVTDGLLACAELALAAGEARTATELADLLSGPRETRPVRVAAFRLRVRAAGDGGAGLVVAALRGPDPALQAAAALLAAELRGTAATTRLAEALPDLAPVVQVALLDALTRRDDPAAVEAVAKLVDSPDATVASAACRALGELGDGRQVALLAAAAANGSARDAARRALLALHRGDVARALLTALGRSPSAVQVVLIDALAARGERSAVPVLLRLTAGADRPVGAAAARALGRLADDRQAPDLLALVTTGDEAVREDAAAAYVAVGQRSARREQFAADALAALAGAAVPVRCALLQAAGQLGGAPVLAALRAAVTDAAPAVREAATRTMAEHAGVEALPDLLALARDAATLGLRTVALRGYWRLVALCDDRSQAARLQLCQEGLAAAARPEEQRLGLGELARLAHPGALALAQELGARDELRAEAEVAILQIAGRLILAERPAAEAALRRLAAGAVSEQVRAGAKAAEATLNQRADYVVPWVVTGPYRQAGLECQALFDVAFPPENPLAEVLWQPAPPPAQLTDFWWVDLASVVQGNHCVVYLRTRVQVSTAETVRVDLGSDDGIKLWVNGALVHANNAVRGFTADQDHAQARLEPGWNDLLVKISQHTVGCAVSVRLRRADGSPLPGLRCDPRQAPTVAIAPPPPPVPTSLPPAGYRKLRLSDQFYAEGSATGDLNRDGALDVVAGPFWFAGPTFEQRRSYRAVKAFDPHNYSDNFFTFTADFNADGWTDVLVVGFPGQGATWYENPADRDGDWPAHPACPVVGNESPTFGDVTGDGRPELLCCTEGYLGYYAWDPQQPGLPWAFHAVSPQDQRFQRFTHGLGYGDLNGDGRVDLVESTGWWEQPADAAITPWPFHAQRFAEAGAQLLVTDVDGDGLADVITTWHCHRYGLVWHRQATAADGQATWTTHEILAPNPGAPDQVLRVSQLHALALVDLNADGLPDILTGKRYWSHGPTGDVEPGAPAVVLWFELRREAAGARFIAHGVDDDSGVGTQVSAADLNGDGRPDPVVANKQGIFVHLSR